MKSKLAALSRHYLAALQKYLPAAKQASLAPAHRLGAEALALGLKTPDLAHLHETALATLGLTDCSSTTRTRLTRHAEMFFAEAGRAIKKTHRPSLETKAQANRPGQTPTHQTAQLAATNRSLKQGLQRHKTAEAALRTSGRENAKVLQESQQLQEHLRHLTHQLLSAQEVERTKISHELHDDVAQTLLGIQVRLLTLKKAASGSASHLRKVIASTQRAVKESIHSINRLAHELDLPHPAHSPLRRAWPKKP